MTQEDITLLREAKKKDQQLIKFARYNTSYWHRLRANIVMYQELIKRGENYINN